MAGAAFYDLEGTLVSTNLVHTLSFYAGRQPSLMASVKMSAATFLSLPVFAVTDQYSRKVFNDLYFKRYKGQSEDRLRYFAQDLFEDVIKPAVFPGTYELIEKSRSPSPSTFFADRVNGMRLRWRVRSRRPAPKKTPVRDTGVRLGSDAAGSVRRLDLGLALDRGLADHDGLALQRREIERQGIGLVQRQAIGRKALAQSRREIAIDLDRRDGAGPPDHLSGERTQTRPDLDDVVAGLRSDGGDDAPNVVRIGEEVLSEALARPMAVHRLSRRAPRARRTGGRRRRAAAVVVRPGRAGGAGGGAGAGMASWEKWSAGSLGVTRSGV